ncbi:MAG: NifU-like protein involved in Fe-S cluster formation [Paracoccaceae bacterium]
MVSNQDMIKLYSKKILALATEIPLTEPIESPDVSITRRSPLCGSMVIISIKMRDNQILEFSQDIKACALGQAAASIIGSSIIGCSIETVEKGRDQLLSMLTADGPVPGSPFDELEVLQPAREYKNRHASIMLVLEATLEGMLSLKHK